MGIDEIIRDLQIKHGKDEVISSTLIEGSKERETVSIRYRFFFFALFTQVPTEERTLTMDALVIWAEV